MICMQNNQNIQPAETAQKTLIKDTVRRIDQVQKEATLQNACDRCEDSLFTSLYNTRPVSFYLCSGSAYTVLNPATQTPTTLFRIEDVRGDGVVLRILVQDGDAVTCTNFTTVLSLDCVCGLQCFAPICCEECTNGCNNA